MATKKKKTSTKKIPKDPFIVRFNRWYADERVRIFIGIISVIMSLLFFIAFVSYLFTWKQDQSMFDYGFFEFFFSSDIQVNNLVGKLGAWTANLFIKRFLGISAFVFVYFLLFYGLHLLRATKKPIKRNFLYAFFGALWISVFFGYIFGAESYIMSGSHGVGVSRWLNSVLGKIGTGIFLFLILFAFILFTVENSLFLMNSFMANLAKSKNFKVAMKNAKISFDNFKQKNEQNKQNTTNQNIDENDNVFYNQENKQNETTKNKKLPDEIVKSEKYILNTDGKKDLGFEVENTINKEEEKINLIETAEKLNDKIHNRQDLIVEKNEDVKLDENLELDDYDPTLELSSYKLPPLDILKDHSAGTAQVTDEELLSNKNKIVETLANYKIKITKIKATIGPTITLYEIIPAPGVRISKIKNLEDDIALSLAALGIRIIAPMPGRGTIGIEVPNQKPSIVSMKSVIASSRFQTSKYELPIALGKTISNESYVIDLTKMPHLLVAGATGQGKSVGLNVIITSILYKKHPSQVKFVLVDPKKVELTLYERLERHYLAKLPDMEEAIITDNKKVIETLNSLNKEMESRYNLLRSAQVRNIKEYNDKFISRRLNPEKGHRFLPYLILIIDEFADLIMTAGKEIELPLARLAQLARAVGIHLIVATQRPSTNIITGIIKANFPARISFKVSSGMESRIILDTQGANQLIGRGDMLISQGSELTRLQCAFIDTQELDNLTEYIGSQRGYPTPFLLPEPDLDGDGAGNKEVDMAQRDELFEDAARIVVINQQGSTSLIQRKLSIGYNRAGRIIDQLEAFGIVGPFEGSKARKVLFQDEYSLEQYLNSIRDKT